MSKPTKFQFVQMSNQYKALCVEYSRIFEMKELIEQGHDRKAFALGEIKRRRKALYDTLKLWKRDVQTGLPWKQTVR